MAKTKTAVSEPEKTAYVDTLRLKYEEDAKKAIVELKKKKYNAIYNHSLIIGLPATNQNRLETMSKAFEEVTKILEGIGYNRSYEIRFVQDNKVPAMLAD